MSVETFLGNPPANISAWIVAHSQPAWHVDTYVWTDDIENPPIVAHIEGEITSDDAESVIGEESWASIIKIEIGSAVTSIGNNAFSSSGVMTVVIPSSVTTIGEYAFYGSSVRFMTISDAVSSIGSDAFSDCSNLTSVTITADGGDAQAVKQMMIAAGVPSGGVTWNMPS